MKILNIAFDCYIKSSIHIALAVFSLTQITVFVLKIPKIENAILGFIFFGTIVFYNAIKYYHLKKVFFQSNFNKIILFVSIISLFFQIYFFLQIDFYTQIHLLSIGIVALLYPILRKIKYLKMSFVAFCVAYITAFIPILSSQAVLMNFKLFLFVRFLLLFCLLIPFEISDFALDKKSIKTIPHQFGIQATKILGYFIIILLYFLENDWKMQFVLFLTVISIYFSNHNSSKYFTSFWVESIPFIGYCLFLIEKII